VKCPLKGACIDRMRQMLGTDERET
jgi:hypothetical protein